MLIFYVRHGEPIYKPNQLTPLGERQAEAVAKRLARYGIDEIYSSPSNRAMQTAKPLCELLGKEMITLDFLNESYASKVTEVTSPDGVRAWVWSHFRYSELLAGREVREMGQRWHEHPELAPFRMGELCDTVGRELDAFLAKLGYEHDTERGLYRVTERHAEKRIAIFAHEGMGKIVMSHLLDIPFPYYAAHFDMDHSGVTVISLDDGSSRCEDNDLPRDYARARVLTLSNDAHLYREDFPPIHYSSKIVTKY